MRENGHEVRTLWDQMASMGRRIRAMGTLVDAGPFHLLPSPPLPRETEDASRHGGGNRAGAVHTQELTPL